jgi:REP element-mobilizing transposase RayT
MPRQARLDAPGTLHHVMVRGIDGVAIFRDDQDRDDFLSRIGHLVESTGTRILAWVLMDNHVHLLLFSGPSGIAAFMRRLLTGYAIGFNRRYRRSGHLFQNRYKSIVCEEDVYLLELVRYIHLNPLRASVVKSIEELDRYRWSGHSVLVGKRANEWQECGYVLRQFADKPKTAMRVYRQFVDEGVDQGRRPELVGGGLVRSSGGWSQVLSFRRERGKRAYDDRILGGGDFVSDILKEADKNMVRQLRYGQKGQPIEVVIQRMCGQEGIKEEELKGGGQRRKVSEVRGKIAYHLHREKGIPMAAIARYVGVGTSAIAMAIRRIEIGE